MGNTKKGQRGISFLGKSIRFTEANLEKLEQEGYASLVAQRRLPPTSSADLDGMMQTFVKNRAFFRIALLYGLKAEQPDTKLEDIDDLIASARESGIENLALQRLVLEAYAVATNPSIVPSMRESWKNSDEADALQTRLQNSQKELAILRTKPMVEEAEKAIERARKALDDAMKLSGSPSSNSDSTPEKPEPSPTTKS